MGRYAPKIPDSYTKDYSGEFPSGGPLERVNLTVDGETIARIPLELLRDLFSDISPQLHNDGPDDSFPPNSAICLKDEAYQRKPDDQADQGQPRQQTAGIICGHYMGPPPGE